MSDGGFATIYSIATLLSAVVIIWSGNLAGRLELKKFSITLIFSLAIGCGLMSVSVGVFSLLFSLFILRQVGQGLMYLVGITTMVRYLERSRGKSTALASTPSTLY